MISEATFKAETAHVVKKFKDKKITAQENLKNEIKQK